MSAPQLPVTGVSVVGMAIVGGAMTLLGAVFMFGSRLAAKLR